jgi:hypothetical protein
MKISEIDEVIQLLNEEFIDRIDKQPISFAPFEMRSWGLGTSVSYCGHRVWCDDDDCRLYDDAKDDYEPLRDCLLRESKKVYDLILKSRPDIPYIWRSGFADDIHFVDANKKVCIPGESDEETQGYPGWNNSSEQEKDRVLRMST